MELTKEELEKIFCPASPFDNMTDEEVLFWATPYGLELEQNKKAHEEKIKSGIIEP